MAEALTRNIESFARFLQTAAVSNAEILNFEKIGLDAQVPISTTGIEMKLSRFGALKRVMKLISLSEIR